MADVLPLALFPVSLSALFVPSHSQSISVGLFETYATVHAVPELVHLRVVSNLPNESAGEDGAEHGGVPSEQEATGSQMLESGAADVESMRRVGDGSTCL